MTNYSVEKTLIAILKEILHPSDCKARLSNVDWQEMLEFSSKQNLAHVVFLLLQRRQLPMDRELYKKYEFLYCQAVGADLTQRYELHWLLEACKEKKIRVMPLKGCILKDLYPLPEMRAMGDLDILIDPLDSEKLRQLLCERGYQCVMYGVHHHDKYVLPPILTIESHTSLVSPENRVLYRYFHQGFALGKPCGDNPFHYKMQPKEYFLFYLAHFYKHYYDEGGAGIRFVLDFYILKQAWPDVVNERMLKKDLVRLGLWEFYDRMYRLADAWFSPWGKMEDVPEEIEDYIFRCGLFGNDEQRFQNHVAKSGRAGYFLERLFPRYFYMCWHYPLLKKMPLFLPFFWIWRIVTFPIQKKALFRHRIGQFLGKHNVD